jgi:murein L,D-transpeptidase YcbB/YkuD
VVVSAPAPPALSAQAAQQLQTAWDDYKLATWNAQRPRVLEGPELAVALAQVSDGDATMLAAVYEGRLGAPVFFADGRLTHAGARALKIYANAWTHGQPRPAKWPELPETAVWETLFEPRFTDHAPLDEGDLRRLDAASTLVPFPVERLSPAALGQLGALETAAGAKRRELAKLDAQLVAAMWQLARATRHEDKRPKARRGPWQPDTAVWTSPESALDTVVPHHPDYQRLRAAYVHYVALRDAGGFPELPSRLPKIKLGTTHKSVPSLRARLAAEGFVAESGDRPPDTVDDQLAAQIARFQATRHLDRTGVVDKKTLEALRVPAQTLVDRLQFGLHRWQLSSGRDVDYYLRVNIPQFQVQVVRDNDVTHRFDVVVGKGRTQTPRFQGVVDHIVVHPWWFGVRGSPKHVPPGPKNPLGILVLRIQPRHLLIYLHGTNQPHLFTEKVRAFSHGCVRLHDPTVLGGIVLDADPGPHKSTDLPAILENGRKTTKLYLAEPVPVFFEYNTTYVADDGQLFFARDMYGDDRYLRRLVEPPVRPDATWARERSVELAGN